MTSNNNYIGNELELFKNATNWKKYFCSIIAEYIHGDVLEVGAGIGINTNYLVNNSKISSITCIEPDPTLCLQIKKNHKETNITASEIINGTIENTNKTFDTIIYIDVLEHIENSENEIEIITRKLNKGGNLIILVPAFNFLYSEFDKKIGHYRRYGKKLLRFEINNKLNEKKLFYLDSLGFFASLVNKIILKKNTPSEKNIYLWDKKLIPITKLTDKLICNTFGKSLIGIYQKTN
jgi:2-polyprenyl-3-methyl-5-hydroxy-6-metoxy-1,4-benzoquinol methylase